MTLYLIRHGETDWNKARKLQGREDIALNETGILQAHECGKAFSRIAVDLILTSPLKRAKSTAEIISGYTGAGVIVESRLIERDFGKYSGLTPEERAALSIEKINDETESRDDMIARLMPAIDYYLSNGQPGCVIMVSHGAAINIVLSVLSGGEIGSGKTLLKNTCINKIGFINGKACIEFINLSPDEFINSMDRDS